ncbi:MAG: pyridoxamine 5'-phosphate oxidase family protein [Ruminococcaceae bacterium]|nr:pyridoxamine 5'-phosphate oxidase family protein [Oscillospiraceae bacterium]
MRRSDREVTDPSKIREIIDRCVCCRIGFYDEGDIYILPLNFGYERKQGGYTFYFHGAKEGRKITLIEKSPHVGFEMDANYALNESELPCNYSARFQSIIGTGTVSMITEKAEQKHALEKIMEHSTQMQKKWEFSEEMLNAVSVFQLDVIQLSCKEHL